ncbi:glucose-6-phosphate dehydrogenase (NADP(+)) [Rhodococcus sp. BP-252]|nr:MULTISPECIES: glucose-6-phosphate dehydrogenase (NADP(+)) [unclassified Rhodococcus (in: high G+C Gram-positive bacteria)]MBY6414260.1 glucose-6-phosphate dehydrogenase (NADP(+)) [Rhodococcus sp. BP-320]MBY6419030.1 glucose-6-phosphate dehydrogenase (NADP(+)) [Rhodococcus sp. BP-321]MBY6423139.1 glucose-6-phosphate dehydrogenase (NADP(+)) [Rhodococcus sp. BP-324]MBY6429064.1 glucose-6-phosphate dehydrogenase (NADP(+)) [Rhodococcus sp. BP-323]MBY6434070.1 glucose-6-phosphate dehydrogenase (N
MMDHMASVQPTIFVLFGATGDLAKRMVLPSFYELHAGGLLPEKWVLIGNGRHDTSDEEFRDHVHDALDEFGSGTDHWDAFSERIRFAGKGFTVDDPGALPDVIEAARKDVGDDAQLVHYIALPPTTFEDYTKALGAHGLAEGARVVYEKPFGTSQKNFEELDKVVHGVLDEKQVYRIDHFLGKEATQNLHVLRFANGMVDGIWNSRHVEQVQIDVPETLNIDDRAEFYDETGAVLDMLVTHLFQVAAEVAIEPPASMSAEDLQSARESVIGSFRPIDTSEVVLGQYDGYRDVEGVADDSTVDTFVAAKLWVDTDRWRGVPFLLRTGKMLGVSAQRVSLVFRKPPNSPLTGIPDDGTVLSFDLSGNGAIDMSMTVKEPGPDFDLSVGHLSLPLKCVPDAEPLSPYSRLILDVLNGDRSLFTRPDGLAQVWKVAAPLLDNPPRVENYAPGTMGPDSADDLASPCGWLVR